MDIVLEYSGWCRINAKNARFVYIGNDENQPENITGEDYIKLSKDEKSKYLIEDAVATIRDADENEWTDLSLVVE